MRSRLWSRPADTSVMNLRTERARNMLAANGMPFCETSATSACSYLPEYDPDMLCNTLFERTTRQYALLLRPLEKHLRREQQSLQRLFRVISHVCIRVSMCDGIPRFFQTHSVCMSDGSGRRFPVHLYSGHKRSSMSITTHSLFPACSRSFSLARSLTHTYLDSNASTTALVFCLTERQYSALDQIKIK